MHFKQQQQKHEKNERKKLKKMKLIGKCSLLGGTAESTKLIFICRRHFIPEK